jgi:hypothetical protein
VGHLLAEAVPLALGAAVSPVTLLAMTAILSGARPVIRGMAFTAGVALVTALALGLGVLVIDVTGYTEGATRGPLGSPVARIIVGLLLVVFAGYVMLRRRAGSGGRIAQLLENPATSTPRFFAIGIGVMVVNISSLVLLLAVINRVAQADVRLGSAAVVLVIVELIVILPAGVPLLAAGLGGERARMAIRQAGGFLDRYGRYIVGTMLVVFGTQHLLEGLAGL